MKKTLINLLYLTIVMSLLCLTACSSGNANSELLESAYNDFYTSQDESALEKVQSILAEDPEDSAALALQGALKLRQEDGEGALADANQALELNPKLGFAHVVRSWYFDVYQGDAATAQAESVMALELDPESAFAYNNQAMLDFSNDDITAALSNLEKSIELAPNYYNSYVNLGGFHMYNENYGESIAAFNKAIELNPSKAQAYANRGDSYLYSGDNESALNDYNHAIDAGFEEAYIYYNRAWIYSLLDENASALLDFEKVIELDPENPDAYNSAAYTIALLDGDLEKALSYVDKALQIAPDQPSKLDTKGYILYKMQKYDEALQIFNDLIEQDHLYAYFGRGLVYYAMQNNDKAVSDLNAFLSEYPDEVQSREAEEILDKIAQ